MLWFSDDPALNQQTRHRLEQASDRLRNRLVTVEHPFRYQKLQAGNVYFLNTSKLSKNSLLVRGRDDADALPGFDAHPDTVPFTFWDTLRNTIEDDGLTLYMVLDEAKFTIDTKELSAELNVMPWVLATFIETLSAKQVVSMMNHVAEFRA